MSEPARREGGQADRSGDTLPWTGLALSVVSLAALITVALVTRAHLNRLRTRNDDLEKQAKDLAATNSKLTSEQAALKARCARLESRIPDEAQLRKLATQVARDEISKSGPRRERDPAGNTRAALEKRGDEIAAIREKIKRGEMTEKQGREAIATKVQDGLKAFLPGDTLKQMEKARIEREKDMTPDQKKQAAKTRNAVIDGIGEWMEVQTKVKAGKMTREEARELMQKKWRARIEEFRKMREAGKKLPEAKEEF